MSDREHPLVAKLRQSMQNPDYAIRRIDRELKRPELWGAAEVAAHLGVRASNVYKMRGLPEPVVVLQRGKLWSAYEIRAFAERRRRDLS